MNKEGLTSNIIYSSEDIGKAFKIILNRLNEAKNEKTEISHICSTCKHRCTETYLTQDWMVEKVWHNWCALDKKYMETEYGHGNGEHFSEPCNHWEMSDYYEDKEANVYDTSCRNPHILIEGTPKENNYEYCPYCGKKIKEVE